MELNIRPKRNIRAPKMCGFIVEPVFKRTRLQVIRLNTENSLATETPLVANTVNKNDNSVLEKQAMHDQDQMLAILVQAGWNVSHGKDPVYIDHQGITYWSIKKAFCVLAKLVQDGKAKRREISAFALVPKDRLSNLIRRVPNEGGIQDSGVGSVEGTSHEGTDVQKDDRITDDLCNVCGEDGTLVFCDSCPSMFHQRCLDIQDLPSGDWYCVYCLCKFCKKIVVARKPHGGALVSEMMSCSLCEENFHRSCIKKVKALNINSSSLYFCGAKCCEIHTKLNESSGKKTQLQDRFSFSLLKSYDLRKRLNKLDPIKAECKPKLAKAFDILNKCFHRFVDDINHTNIIKHLVYNRGSHIRRLNYLGFFTAILEKDDEVISTATIRIHGNKLAEIVSLSSMNNRQNILGLFY